MNFRNLIGRAVGFTWMVLAFVPLRSQADVDFREDLLKFSRQAAQSNACMLFSAHYDSLPIRLLEKPEASAPVMRLVAQGAPCRILEKSRLANGDTWYQIELMSENQSVSSISGWLAYYHVVTVASVRPMDEGRKVLLTFRPICDKSPCSGATWVISNFYQRELPIGQEPLYVDSKGENFIYKKQIKRVMSRTLSPDAVSYETVILRYNLRHNAFKILATEKSQMAGERILSRGAKGYTQISTAPRITVKKSGDFLANFRL